MSAVTNTTLRDFQTDVLEASRSQLVILDVWAAWCPKCLQLAPSFQRIAESAQRGDSAKFVKLEIDMVERFELAGFELEKIPTLFAVRRGEIVGKLEGVALQSRVEHWFDDVKAAEMLQDPTVGFARPLNEVPTRFVDLRLLAPSDDAELGLD